jgi:hypothetical protein
VSVKQRGGKTRPRPTWPRSPVSYASGKTVSRQGDLPGVENRFDSRIASLVSISTARHPDILAEGALAIAPVLVRGEPL